jgi:hypothetical protein
MPRSFSSWVYVWTNERPAAFVALYVVDDAMAFTLAIDEFGVVEAIFGTHLQDDQKIPRDTLH